MEIFRKTEEIKYKENTVVTIGTFDGVHLAHRQIIEKVKDIARNKAGRSLIITFDPHPQEVLKSRIPDIKLLNTIDEKLDIFEMLGIDSVYIIKFTVEFSKTHATEFYENYISKKTGISDLVVGFDHLFGKDREGDFGTLVDLGRKLNFNVHKVEEIDINGEKVSSTRIRRNLAEGNIEEVNGLLGYKYGYKAKVVMGDKRGRTLGYPTANLEPIASNKQLPGDGVYTVQMETAHGRFYGMLNSGYRPTVTEGKKHVIEVNLFDFDMDIYDETVKVKFITKLRDEKKFSSKEELLEQLKTDKQNSLKFISNKIKN